MIAPESPNSALHAHERASPCSPSEKLRENIALMRDNIQRTSLVRKLRALCGKEACEDVVLGEEGVGFDWRTSVRTLPMLFVTVLNPIPALSMCGTVCLPAATGTLTTLGNLLGVDFMVHQDLFLPLNMFFLWLAVLLLGHSAIHRACWRQFNVGLAGVCLILYSKFVTKNSTVEAIASYLPLELSTVGNVTLFGAAARNSWILSKLTRNGVCPRPRKNRFPKPVMRVFMFLVSLLPFAVTSLML